ncbi:MAG: hypothetical protein H6813_06680 [Phycisphaeraceae bacterium]|nr:hypothetical protein [Phycisphaeraceae bacterium]MCB9848156.1 hypothetical protein [Phycisphaeraceae bacterium]
MQVCSTLHPEIDFYNINPCTGGCPDNRYQASLSGTGEEIDTRHPDDELNCDDETATRSPVDLRYGDKLDGSTDLSIRLPGHNFALKRRYSSNPIFTSDAGPSRPNIIGAQWTLTNLNFVVMTVVNGGPDVVDWYHGGNARMRFVQDANDAALFHGPPNTTVFLRAEGFTGSLSSVDEFRIIEPGHWTRIFHGSQASTMRGKPKLEYDNRGSVIRYGYANYGRQLGGGQIYKVLTHLEFESYDEADNPVDTAIVWFNWGLAGDQSDSDYGDSSRIKAVKVFRPDPDDDKFYLTQSVFYTYYRDVEVDPSRTVSADIGQPGDLVQVTHLTRVDGSVSVNDGLTKSSLIENIGNPSRLDSQLDPLDDIYFNTSNPIRRQVTQYRYHRTADSAYDGEDHQLHMVLPPQQIEYYEWKTGNAAETLLDSDNDAAAISGESLDVQDLASKIVTYIVDSQSDSYQKVATQTIQTNCGCGGGSAHGKKLFYTYEIDENGFGPGDAIVRSTIIEEKLYDSQAGTYSIAHKTYWHDMERVDLGGSQTDLMTRYRAVSEGDKDDIDQVGTRAWTHRMEYFDSASASSDGEPGQLRREFTPSAMEEYWRQDPTTYANEFSDFASSGGLVHHYTYYGGSTPTRRLKNVAVSEVARAGTTTNPPTFPSFSLIEQYEYSSVTGRDDLPTKISRVRIEGESSLPTDPDDIEVQQFQYTFDTFDVGEDGTVDTLSYIEEREVFTERELPEENGPASGPSAYIPAGGWEGDETALDDGYFKQTEFLRRDGLTKERWLEDSTAERFEYDPHTGAVTKRIHGYYDHADFEGTTQTTPDLLISEYTNDILGRVTARRSPSGRVTSIRREMRAIGSPDDPDGAGSVQAPDRYALMRFPASASATGQPSDADGASFDGPIKIDYLDTSDSQIATESFVASSITRNSEGEVAGSSDYSLGSALERSYMVHDVAGLVVNERRWHHTGASSGNGYYESDYTYDDLGRAISYVNANGTETLFEYDVLDRLIKARIGTEELQESAYTDAIEYFYDSPQTATQGVGNGNITLVRYHVDASITRDFAHTYDTRDRLVEVEGPDSPDFEVHEYDNLDREVRNGLFAADPGSSPFSSTNANRGLVQTTDFSQRGLVYRSRIAMDPTADLSSASNYLESHRWYDSAGRVRASWDPNQPANVTSYDELGRESSTFISDRAGDGTSIVGSGSWSAILSLSGDTILEQSNLGYVEPDVDRTGSSPAIGEGTSGAGRVSLQARRYRAHDATGTGALNQLSSAQVITTYQGLFYDAADRMIRQMSFGTNTDESDDVFEHGGSTPTWSVSSLPEVQSGDLYYALISQRNYDDRGLIQETEDPEGLVTRYVYDDLGRNVGIIENYQRDDANTADVTRGSEAWVWVADLGDSPTASDEDRITISAFDGLDNVTHRVAAFWDSATSSVDYQVTRYYYGVRQPGQTPPSGGTAESDLASNDLLARVVDPVDYETISGDPTAVPSRIFSYNRLSETIATKDRRAVQHLYSRDDRGRITLDRVNNFGSEDVSNWADRIAQSYDDMGRPERVSTLNSTTVLNAAEILYNGLWQVAFVRQNPNGDLGVSDALEDAVEYTYDQLAVAGVTGKLGNHSRIDEFRYPSDPTSGTRTAISHTYEPSGIGERISRVSKLSWNGPSVTQSAEYAYLGLNMLAQKEFAPLALDNDEVRLDRFTNPDATNPQTSGEYHGYDRFGRIKRQLWIRKFDAPQPPGGGGPGPDFVDIPFIDLKYAYDGASNITERDDFRDGVDRDEFFIHDGLHRLIRDDAGEFGVGIGGPRGQRWDLDALGNWVERSRNLDGNYVTSPEVMGVFTDNADLQETREANLVNEITDRDISLPADSISYSDTPTYLQNGNFRERLATFLPGDTSAPDETWRYRYDAWDRLVEVQIDPDQQGFDDRTLYQYNGLHQRTRRDVELDTGGYDERSYYYYDSDWRLVEERTGDLPWSLTEITQRIWCPMYIDTLLFVQTDTSGALGDFTDATGRWAFCDHRYDLIASLGSTGSGFERVRYSPYGVPQVELLADINGDYTVDSSDQNELLASYYKAAGDSAYSVDSDLNFDGTVNTADLGILLGAMGDPYPPEGEFSENGMLVGYAGYIYDPDTLLWLARRRWLDSSLGVWMSRDPLEYIDSMHLYQYSQSLPIEHTDPFGSEAAQPGLPTGELTSAAVDILHSTFDLYSYAYRSMRGQIKTSTPKSVSSTADYLSAYYLKTGQHGYVEMSPSHVMEFATHPSVILATYRIQDHFEQQIEQFAKDYVNFGCNTSSHGSAPFFYRNPVKHASRKVNHDLRLVRGHAGNRVLDLFATIGATAAYNYLVANEPLFSLGDGTVDATYSCNGEISWNECGVIIIQYDCLIEYSVNDLFEKPLDNNYELGGEPYEIHGSWTGSCSGDLTANRD